MQLNNSFIAKRMSPYALAYFFECLIATRLQPRSHCYPETKCHNTPQTECIPVKKEDCRKVPLEGTEQVERSRCLPYGAPPQSLDFDPCAGLNAFEVRRGRRPMRLLTLAFGIPSMDANGVLGPQYKRLFPLINQRTRESFV